MKIAPALVIGGILLTAIACEEKPSPIGENLLPGGDFVTIKSTDTLSVKTYTMYKDSVRSDDPAVSYLGSLYDPYFGTTTAGFVTQIGLSDSLTDEDFFVVDSVKLYLTLLTVKGDTASEHLLKFSETSEKLDTGIIYYSNREVPLTGKSWSVSLPPLKADTINDIVVTVPVDFGEYVTRDEIRSKLKLPDIKSYFKGLYFEITSDGNPIFVSLSVRKKGTAGAYVNFFTLFMHDEVGTSMSYDFILDANLQNVAYNLYKHDFSTADPDKKIHHINDGVEDTLSYIQNMNGVYTRIELPSLAKLKNDTAFKNIAVNKARLILPFVTDGVNFTNSTIASPVYLRYIVSNGHKWMVQDYLEAGTTFYDGTPDTTTTFSYKINLATYLQRYLNDKTDTITPHLELFLLPTSSYNAVLKANKSYKPPKFELTYTKF